MTEDNFFKAQRIRGLIIKMESTLKTIEGKCQISAFVNGEDKLGGMSYNLSADKDIDATIRKGMIDALEKRIEELNTGFALL